jgi:hypothetical protein
MFLFYFVFPPVLYFRSKVSSINLFGPNFGQFCCNLGPFWSNLGKIWRNYAVVGIIFTNNSFLGLILGIDAIKVVFLRQ